MSTTMTKLPDDHPMMVAWKAFQATEEFANAEKWAQVVDLRIVPGDLQIRYPHLQGSLWCLFMNGYLAAERSAETQGEKR